jgi:hypothetical protein
MDGPPVPNDRRRLLPRATLGFLQLPPRAPELRLLHNWLNSWRGVGLLAVGLHRVGYDLDLRQYGDDHWRATFYVTGFAHSILGGSALGAYGVAGVQRAGWGNRATEV